MGCVACHKGIYDLGHLVHVVGSHVLEKVMCLFIVDLRGEGLSLVSYFHPAVASVL